MKTGEGSEAIVGGAVCDDSIKPGVVRLVGQGSLAQGPSNPSRGAHVNMLWEALRGVLGGSISPEAGLVVIEISHRIEEVQKS